LTDLTAWCIWLTKWGVVLKRRGPSDATDANLLPKEVFVEIGRGTMDLEFGEKPCDGFEPNAAVKPTIQRNACDEKSGQFFKVTNRD
jgi:hypothetical protein